MPSTFHRKDFSASAVTVSTLREPTSRPTTRNGSAHQGRVYQRTNSRHAQDRAKVEGATPPRITDQVTGRTTNGAAEEDRAFWEWAVVETLRHSGIRIEELCELTHLGVRQYKRPNGEVVALLVIAPSKTDRERVIPISAELFAVVAAIIRRHLQSHPSILTIGRMLQRSCEALGRIRSEFRDLTFSANDFRRIFTTELVNNGLSIHIGAALLGHLSLETTRGYVAVFDEDLVRHYQAFLDRRRQARPVDEYRKPTDKEWTEFEEHFDKHRVELGNCGRPYGAPCAREHACIRCPVLQ